MTEWLHWFHTFLGKSVVNDVFITLAEKPSAIHPWQHVFSIIATEVSSSMIKNE
jgi:hypothetical protein